MYEAFWTHTKIPAIGLSIIIRNFAKYIFPLFSQTFSFPFSENFHYQKRLFCFLFSSWRLLHRHKTKACDARSSERRLYTIYLFTQKNFFLLSLEIMSVWWEWVGDRNFLGDIKISPWKCPYGLEIKVAIVLISISKKVSPSGNQALCYVCI